MAVVEHLTDVDPAGSASAATFSFGPTLERFAVGRGADFYDRSSGLRVPVVRHAEKDRRAATVEVTTWAG
jgi:hypothetical protein